MGKKTTVKASTKKVKRPTKKPTGAPLAKPAPSAKPAALAKPAKAAVAKPAMKSVTANGHKPVSKRKKPVAVASPVPKTPRTVSRRGSSLGRPLVTAEEKLYMLFREDYSARQIFEFLRVDTVGDLERYSPQQIIHIVSTPLRKTVQRIRERLADQKRHLLDDAAFARERVTARKAEPARTQ